MRNRLGGPGVGEGGTRAYGGSALAGLIRTWEFERGAIRHALAFALPRQRLRHGPVWPATSEDNDAVYEGHLPMGSFVAIPRQIDLDELGLSPGGLVVARAFQDYGAYLVDASENFTLYAEPNSESLLAGARADLETILDELRVATESAASRVRSGDGRTEARAGASG